MSRRDRRCDPLASLFGGMIRCERCGRWNTHALPVGPRNVRRSFVLPDAAGAAVRGLLKPRKTYLTGPTHTPKTPTTRHASRQGVDAANATQTRGLAETPSGQNLVPSC